MGGVIVKRIMDHLHYRAYSGHPVIWHDRASNAEANAKKEETGLAVHEIFTKAVMK